ncbi:MAG TPA: bifunctional 4-hydroxy-2-oxoglutarate aldolase/2-dehydro-3-deoxy-phosphogluconate aldolase [Blastocatellia bacterium]|nr:bifunctional 4-hydroxy-2-oxoglutarate aldolase/2-dehydro-3-deoxy-phosphogluconate aldolase [Blastocatellia bacterium]
MSIIDRIQQTGIIPVASIPQTEHALPLAEALLEGGLPCAEITFRTAAAADALAQIRQKFPELLPGAGTVLTIAQAQTALEAGAEFIVSPGTNPAVVDYCQAQGVTIFPGVCTPTEIELALSKDVSVLKFFPAEAMGGVKFLKAVCAPYKQVRFIPTGGIEPGNIGDYLALPQVVACGGSWMVKPELMTAGEFAKIRQLAREAVARVGELRKT